MIENEDFGIQATGSFSKPPLFNEISPIRGQPNVFGTPQRVMSSEGSRADVSRLQSMTKPITTKKLVPVTLQSQVTSAVIRTSTSDVTVKRFPTTQ